MPNRFATLECIKCNAKHPIDTHSRCTSCGGILSATYDTRGSFPEPRIDEPLSIWQFRDLLPPVADQNVVSLSEGWTPYVKAERYGSTHGIGDLWCKLEGQNPSGSFKDRIASLGLSLAKEWKKKGVFTASSGNAAASISTYAARAGILCLILIRHDSSAAKLGQISMYNPWLLRVRDLYKTQEHLERALTLTQSALPEWLNHFVWSPYNPLLVDSQKTIAYEIAFSGQKVPDYVFVPVAGGDLLYGIYKGFLELKAFGLIDVLPKLVAVQGAGAAPLVSAIEEHSLEIPPIRDPETVAGALRVGFGAEHALSAVYNTEGFGVALTDAEIIRGQREIAKLEGIFCEVSSAAAVAAVAKATRMGKISGDDTVAAILTGSGFKEYFPTFDDISEVPIAKSPDAIPETIRKRFAHD